MFSLNALLRSASLAVFLSLVFTGCRDATGLDPDPRVEPVVQRMAIMQSTVCLLSASGELQCSSPDSDSTYMPRSGALRFVSVSGGNHFCALTADGAAYCAGSNLFGELGDGTTLRRDRIYPNAEGHTSRDVTPVLTSRRFVSIATAPYSTCALERNGQVWCWGGHHEREGWKWKYHVLRGRARACPCCDGVSLQ